jgi:hypothetical protein
MGIETTLTPLARLENKPFATAPMAACDGRVNFRGIWVNVGTLRIASGHRPAIRRAIGPAPPLCFNWAEAGPEDGTMH